MAVAEHPSRFTRRYHAALLDYLLGSGEEGLAHAYDLGRSALNHGFSLLDILKAHHTALKRILETSRMASEVRTELAAAQEFLIETLSPFEMTCRGYIELLEKKMFGQRLTTTRPLRIIAATESDEP